MKDANQAGTLIIFKEGVDVERIKKWIKQLEKKNVIKFSYTKEFNPNYGSPVWYIP